MKKLLCLVFSLMLVVMAAGCGGSDKQAAAPQAGKTLRLAAAASMEKVFTQKLIPMYQQKHPGIKIEGVYDASGKLQAQIESGLAADVFISAANKQMNALSDMGLAEKSASRKMLMQDYGLNESFFKEIDSSVKRNCRTQNDIQSYLFMYQGFSNDLMMLMGNLMQWKFRMPSIFKKALYGMTQKTVHDVCTKTVWKADDVHKTAATVRQYKERLGYSEQ